MPPNPEHFSGHEQRLWGERTPSMERAGDMWVSGLGYQGLGLDWTGYWALAATQSQTQGNSSPSWAFQGPCTGWPHESGPLSCPIPYPFTHSCFVCLSYILFCILTWENDPCPGVSVIREQHGVMAMSQNIGEYLSNSCSSGDTETQRAEKLNLLERKLSIRKDCFNHCCLPVPTPGLRT